MVRGPLARTSTGNGGERALAVLLSMLMVGSVVAGGIALASGSAVAQDVSVGFDSDGTVQTPVTDMGGPFTVTMSGTDTVTIVMESSVPGNYSYNMNATFTDTDGNGAVTFWINTFALGHYDDPFKVNSGEVSTVNYDEIENESETVPQSEDGNPYEIHVGAGDDPAAVKSSPADTRLFNIDEGEPGAPFDMVTAPAGYEYETITDIYNSSTGRVFADPLPGLSEEGDTGVASGDTMLVMPWGGTLTGPAAYAIEHSNSTDEALQWLIDNDFYTFEMEQIQTSEGEEPKVLDLERALEEDGLTFINGIDVDEAYDNYQHVVFGLDTSAQVFQRGGSGEYVALAPGDRVQTTFNRPTRTDVPYNNLEETANFTVQGRELTIEPPVRTYSEDGKLGGDTTLAPGTNLTVYVQVGEDGELHEFNTEVIRILGNEAGTSEHPWNFSAEETLGDVEPTNIQLYVQSSYWGRLAAEPGGFQPDITTVAPPSTIPPEETTADPTTTDDGATGTDPGTADTTAPGGDETETPSDGGNGGLIPGFTATAALLAVVAAALIALRRD